MRIFEEPATYKEADFALLVDVCRTYKQQLIQLFQTKYVQTNEVQRASYLYPIFAMIHEEAKRPLTLIEIGTSAGLLLHVDAYHYDIDQSPPCSFGDVNSPLRLRAKNEGMPIPPFTAPPIVQRIGIDLNIIDVDDEEQYNWLQCLIWPEQTERKRNLHIARQVQRASEATLLQGDF